MMIMDEDEDEVEDEDEDDEDDDDADADAADDDDIPAARTTSCIVEFLGLSPSLPLSCCLAFSHTVSLIHPLAILFPPNLWALVFPRRLPDR